MPDRFATRVCLCALLASIAAAPVLAAAERVDYVFLEQPSSTHARPLPKYRFLFGEAARWPSAYRWRYNPANAPGAFGDVEGAVADLSRTLDTWARSCGITHVYEGVTTTPPNRRVNGQPDLVNVVGWAPLEGDTAGLTYAWYTDGSEGPELTDSDVILSPSAVTSPQAMERTAKHEWGHALGLAHSDRAGMLMSGPPVTAYNGLTSLQFDDIRGCRCLYGAPASQPAGYSCSVPSTLDLGAVPVGVPSAPRTLAITNDGNAPLTIATRSVTHPELRVAGGCEAQSSVPPGSRCTMTLVATAPAAGTFTSEVLVNTSDGPYLVTVRFTGSSAPPSPQAANVVEFFHGGLGHYFVTSIAAEIGALDAGTIPGWQRTGASFRAWGEAQAQPPTVPVCRFFSARFAPKSSHFYSASAKECTGLMTSPDWQFEGDVFHVVLPDATGTCAGGTQAVYRLYNEGLGGAPNHRFVTDPALRTTMLAQGWVPEGAGLGVTMCGAP